MSAARRREASEGASSRGPSEGSRHRPGSAFSRRSECVSDCTSRLGAAGAVAPPRLHRVTTSRCTTTPSVSGRQDRNLLGRFRECRIIYGMCDPSPARPEPRARAAPCLPRPLGGPGLDAAAWATFRHPRGRGRKTACRGRHGRVGPLSDLRPIPPSAPRHGTASARAAKPFAFRRPFRPNPRPTPLPPPDRIPRGRRVSALCRQDLRPTDPRSLHLPPSSSRHLARRPA